MTRSSIGVTLLPALLIAWACLLAPAAGAQPVQVPSPAPLHLCQSVQPQQARNNCRLVVRFYDAFFNGRQFAIAEKLVAESYRQHNPDTPDGRQPLIDYFTGYLREHPQARSRIVRVSATGDLVWLHVHDTSGPQDRGSAVVDIFRVRGGRIVEHWDVIQAVPEKQAHGNTMF